MLNILSRYGFYYDSSRMGLSRTWLDTAAVEHAVLQRVGPGGGPCGHGGVIVKSVPAQHVEHLVPTNCQEWSSHTLDICRVNSSIPDQQLSLSNNFISPFLLIEISSKRVSDCVGGNLMTISI